MRVYNLFLTMSLTLLASCSHAQEPRTDSAGEAILTYSSDIAAPSSSRQEVFRWTCDDPAEIEILYILADNGYYKTQFINIKVGNRVIDEAIADRLRSFSELESFKIYTLCQGGRPVILIKYAEEFVENNDDGFANAKIRSERIYLRPPANQ